MNLVNTTRPIMPQLELIFIVVDITPAFGYEYIYSGTAEECIQWQKDNGRGDIPLYNQIEVDEDMITSIQSKAMIDAISTKKEQISSCCGKEIQNDSK